LKDETLIFEHVFLKDETLIFEHIGLP